MFLNTTTSKWLYISNSEQLLTCIFQKILKWTLITHNKHTLLCVIIWNRRENFLACDRLLCYNFKIFIYCMSYVIIATKYLFNVCRNWVCLGQKFIIISLSGWSDLISPSERERHLQFESAICIQSKEKSKGVYPLKSFIRKNF